MPNAPLSSSIQTVYDQQYVNSDAQWREIGARQKADDIIKLCQKFNFKKVLDVGAGDGAVLKELDSRGFTENLHAVEISGSGIEKINERQLKSLREVKLFDGYTIPYEDKAFSLATCSHVIEHVEHPRLLLREIARVSEYQFFEVPIDFSMFVDRRIDHFLSYGHINIYTPALFKFLLKSEGFEVIDELFLFFSDEVVSYLMKDWKQRLVYKTKAFLLNNSPLRQVKPNAYAVLCKHKGEGVKIF
ncbi:class I SAM-dependent methyltransferase [Runella aurantiaca]|uniref:Class I SAM-dependent methyltransferase n=1 Tax=Runella aurantiaca TaxID=2282308 RepID=A0A369IEX3_9BACT|nr:class I SAM-dependent methyltransferase [Runella aurantiaca]RDB07602.1 class I SAM-dependent methyltransferase [Runella aurantiaca]